MRLATWILAAFLLGPLASAAQSLPAIMMVQGSISTTGNIVPLNGDTVLAINSNTGTIEGTGSVSGGSYSMLITKQSSFNGTGLTLVLQKTSASGSTNFALNTSNGRPATVQFNGGFFPITTTLNVAATSTVLSLGPTSYGSTAGSLMATNSLGNAHGIQVFDNRTVISGGLHSTSLTLDDFGATFRNMQTGGPVRVTGVADGSSPFDAVNYRQLRNLGRELAAGIAATNAVANIPQVDPGKTFSLGVGVGGYEGQTAIAIGGSYRAAENTVIRASIGAANNGTTSFGAGAAMSW